MDDAAGAGRDCGRPGRSGQRADGAGAKHRADGAGLFFFFAAAGQQGAAQNAVDTEDFYGIWGVGLFMAASLSLLIWALSKKFPMKRIYEHVAPRKMNIQSFAMLSASLFGIRFISKLLLSGLEKLLFEMGIPATLVANSSEELTSSIIFVLYLGVMAPVVEEFIFRGFS